MPKRQRFNSGLQDSRRQFSREDILRMVTGRQNNGFQSSGEMRTDLLPTIEEREDLVRDENLKFTLPTMKERSDLISNENLKLGREMIQLMGSGKKSRRKKKVK